MENQNSLSKLISYFNENNDVKSYSILVAKDLLVLIHISRGFGSLYIKRYRIISNTENLILFDPHAIDEVQRRFLIVELNNRHFSQDEISDFLDISQSTVSNTLKSLSSD